MPSFVSTLTSVVAERRVQARPRAIGDCEDQSGALCRLCHAGVITYEQEVPLKEEALRRFWQDGLRDIPRARLVASPAGRGYRTVTKRKVFSTRSGPRLGLIDPEADNESGYFDVVRCNIEPPVHARVYAHIQEFLSRHSRSATQDILRYVVLKQALNKTVLILTVNETSAAAGKFLTTLSKSVTRAVPEVAGVYVYEATGTARYYLGTEGRDAGSAIRRMYGVKTVGHTAGGLSFHFPPWVFSQTNHAILDGMIGEARRLLAPAADDTLVDLYCGYGLFTLSLSRDVREAIGIELSRDAVTAATENAEHHGIRKARFVRDTITGTSLQTTLRSVRTPHVVLLDPPRQGTGQGVIETIAAGKPRRVVHVFCAIDLMPAELARWRNEGYAVTEAVPLDMFPGTGAVEVMAALSPRQ